ncbi:MAG TPA: hypothetical protein VGM23_09890 [Armatimonadota bacterium]|jgi:curli biogenesis system outer membrane secretion channel CsgG
MVSAPSSACRGKQTALYFSASEPFPCPATPWRMMITALAQSGSFDVIERTELEK